MEIVFSEDKYLENEFEERNLHIAENEGDGEPVVHASSQNGSGNQQRKLVVFYKHCGNIFLVEKSLGFYSSI